MKELHKIRWPMKDFNSADMVLCFNDCIEAITELQSKMEELESPEGWLNRWGRGLDMRIMNLQKKIDHFKEEKEKREREKEVWKKHNQSVRELIFGGTKDLFDKEDKKMRDHAAKVLPGVWGEPRYTLAELREKWVLFQKSDKYWVMEFLEWLEEDSKKIAP